MEGAGGVTSAHRLTVLLTQEAVAREVQRLAQEIEKEYQGKRPLLVGILKGSFVFLADLIRAMNVSLTLDFLRLSSYGSGTTTSGMVRVIRGLGVPARGRHVLVVEDIVDSGLTIQAAIRYLARQGPASLRLCSLLDKPARRQVPVTIDYCGFTVPDYFLVGYGLDLAEEYRYLPGVYRLEEVGDGPETSHRRRPRGPSR